MKKLLQIHNITKIFGEGTINEKVAINNLSITLEEGDFVTVIGNNGAGKSTLMNAIAGVFPMDEGQIIIGEKDVTKEPEHKRAKHIGRVFQDPLKGTAFDMTIEENLAIAACKAKPRGLQRGLTKADPKAFKEQLGILEMGLEDKLTQKVKLLSGGQRQALTLFMATMANPEILLLDEHTAALDPKTAAKVLEITDKLVKENNLTTLMITHNMKDAIAHGNRLIMMNEGRIVYDVSGEEKKNLTVEDLMKKFSEVGGHFSDRAILG